MSEQSLGVAGVNKFRGLGLLIFAVALNGCTQAEGAAASSSVTVRLPPARPQAPEPAFSVRLRGAIDEQTSAAAPPGG